MSRLRTLALAFVAFIAGRVAWAFVDEILRIEDTTRDVARSVDPGVVSREVTL